MLCLSNRPGLIFPGLKYCTFNMAAQCLRLPSKLSVICVWCLLFHSGILQNIKHKQLDLFHFNYFKCYVHVYTRLSQSNPTNVSLGLFMRTVRLWLHRRIVNADLGVIFFDLPQEILNNFPILRL